MGKTIRIRVNTSARRVGNSIRVKTSVSNGSSTRTTSKTIHLK